MPFIAYRYPSERDEDQALYDIATGTLAQCRAAAALKLGRRLSDDMRWSGADWDVEAWSAGPEDESAGGVAIPAGRRSPVPANHQAALACSCCPLRPMRQPFYPPCAR